MEEAGRRVRRELQTKLTQRWLRGELLRGTPLREERQGVLMQQMVANMPPSAQYVGCAAEGLVDVHRHSQEAEEPAGQNFGPFEASAISPAGKFRTFPSWRQPPEMAMS